MASNNFVHVCGKLISFEERTTTTGKRVCSLTVLVSNGNKKEGERRDDGHFFDVESWDISPQLAQVLTKKVKDCRVAVTGRLKMDRWEDKKTGAKRSAVRIAGDVVTYIPFKNTGPKPAPAPAPAPEVSTDDQGNEIPF